eukprot:SAG31_NODE_97_length_25714_cov_19.477142_17_plen_105_part_00
MADVDAFRAFTYRTFDFEHEPQAINEIMEGGGATRTIQQLTHMRSLLDDVLIQVQNLLQKTLKSGGGRDIKAMTRYVVFRRWILLRRARLLKNIGNMAGCEQVF